MINDDGWEARMAAREESARDEMSRADWLANFGGAGGLCADGEQHCWQPVSFVFESQLLDGSGRVLIRQPSISGGRVYMVCVPCMTHTYVVTRWAGYQMGGPDEPWEFAAQQHGARRTANLRRVRQIGRRRA